MKLKAPAGALEETPRKLNYKRTIRERARPLNTAILKAKCQCENDKQFALILEIQKEYKRFRKFTKSILKDLEILNL